MSARRWRGTLALALASAALATMAASAAGYEAEIRRTAGGVPHVKASDDGSLGFGVGYAYATDQLCTLAEVVVTVSAERSRHFGATPGNLASDFFWQRIKDMRTVERLARRPYPHGPATRVKRTLRGFAAGYNAYLRRTGRSRLPDPRCRGARWVRPITELDLHRRIYQLAIRASSGALLAQVVAAEPPGAAAAAAVSAPSAAAVRRALAPEELGSNAYAFGEDATQGGRALLLANPHFPWQGAERFYALHLTIPGRLDAIGAALQGLPVINIGFNRHLAWTHTVSSARRFTPYELELVPGAPTVYRYEGGQEAMRTRVVEVALAGGARARHTFYETRWGPVLDFPGAGLSWTAEHAYALADANADNFRVTNQWAAWQEAGSVAELRRAHARIQGNPWVNVIAADDSGRAYYGDDSVVPHVDDARAQRCSVGAKSALLAQVGIILLDGSRAACAWGRDRDAVVGGIFGPRSLPRVERTDYVANANDSYWLATPRRRLTGFPRIIGAEDAERSLRTRLTFLQADDALRGGGRLTLAELQRLMFANRNLSAELLRRDVLGACEGATAPALLRHACRVLGSWDGLADVGSRGAVLWREFFARLGAPPWRVAFDPARPLTTPRGLDASQPAVLEALLAAAQDLRAKGVSLRARLGDLQAEPRGAERIPIHGCSHQEGCFNVISAARDAQGRYDPESGSSFVMAARLGANGPVGRALLSYSQSENPRSPHYADQTRRFASKRWLPMRFTERQIARDPDYERMVVRSR